MIIETPSRLHLTLIDLNGIYGRIDGGVGITLEKPGLKIQAEPLNGGVEVIFSESCQFIDDLKDDYTFKIENSTLKVTESLNINNGFRFTVHSTYPPHSGLGSGTQLSLAVAKLISIMNKQDLNTLDLAKIVGRGGTSGIGVESFENGGFIIDGGHKSTEKPSFLPSSASNATPPPIIARYDFPRDWKIILVIPNVERGVSGTKEVDAFQNYCPIPLNEVEKLSHLLLMKLMPAVIESDLDSFGTAINKIQDIGFKKVENKLQNPFISQLMENLRIAGAAGVGMSSFGPTVYAITDTNERDILIAANDAIKDVGGEIISTCARNYGAKLLD
ncbi:MAG TPA: beta-ribofuranosylaminobenzene 5'-phosphate synthase [Methanobacterium sp.]